MSEAKKLKFRKSFRLKTVIGIAVIETIVLCIIGWSSLTYLQKSNLEGIGYNAHATARLFSLTAKDALLSMDLASLESYAHELLNNERVKYCRIISVDQGLLVEAGDPAMLDRPFKVDLSTSEILDDIYDVTAAIKAEGFTYGHVELGMSTYHLVDVMVQARSQFILLAILEILLVALFSFGLGYLLTLQLDSLADAAGKISEGIFGYTVPIKTRDELGYTANAFNTMSLQLEKSYGALRTALDESKEKEERLIRSEAQMRGILDNMLDGLISIDTVGKILLYNPAAERIFGYSANEAIGRNVSILMPEPMSSGHNQYINNYLEDGEAKIIGIGREVVGLRKGGEQFPMDLSLSELTLGEDRYFIGLIRDITERKRVEKELFIAIRKAEDASEAKSTFLANMSHELRTPLNAILGYAQILQDEKDLSLLQTNGLKTIQSSGQHLLRLVIDILDISKIEIGNLELDNSVYNLDELLTNVCNMIRIRTEEKNLQFIFNKSPKVPSIVFADKLRLRQILLNILNNGVKFTDKGMIVFRVDEVPITDIVTEKRSQLSGPMVRFLIQDTGIGIPIANQASIFNPFYQVFDKKRNSEGTGLGLAITRELLHLMGSELFIKSSPGEGSSFWFDLELDVRSLDEIAPSDSDMSRIVGYKGPSRHVLVVDDVEDNRKVLMLMLTKLKFVVSEAKNGEECLVKVEENKPDIILLDSRMPVMDGHQTLLHLRKNDKSSAIPVIAITASVTEAKRHQLMESGCNGFLNKPFKKKALLAMLGKYLAIDWVFAESQKVVQTTAQSRDIAIPKIKMPDEIIEQLIRTSRRGNAKKLTELLDNVTWNEDTAAWRDLLLPKIQQFKFDEIIKILRDEEVSS